MAICLPRFGEGKAPLFKLRQLEDTHATRAAVRLLEDADVEAEGLAICFLIEGMEKLEATRLLQYLGLRGVGVLAGKTGLEG